MRWEQQVQYASISDIGFRRRNNQDACATHICPDKAMWRRRGHLFLVADGMGGHAVGELASKIAVDTLQRLIEKDVSDPLRRLTEAIEIANGKILSDQQQHPERIGMGTTISTLWAPEALKEEACSSK